MTSRLQPLAPFADTLIGVASGGQVKIGIEFLNWLEELQRRVEVQAIPAGTVAITEAATEPEGWLFLNGQTITQRLYPALFEIYGDTLPDRRNQIAMGAGDTVALGETAGSKEITLTIEQMPSHTHGVVSIPHTHGAGQEAHDHQISLDPHTHEAGEEEGSEHTHTFTSDPHDHNQLAVPNGSDNVAAGTDARRSAIFGTSSSETVSGTTDAADTELSIVVEPAEVEGFASLAQPEITIEAATAEIEIEAAGGGQAIDITPPVFGANWMVKT